MSLLYYVSPNIEQNDIQDDNGMVTDLFINYKVYEICTRYKKCFGYMIAAYFLAREIKSEDIPKAREMFAYALGTHDGKMVFEMIPSYFHPELHGVEPKYLSYTKEQFLEDPELEQFISGTQVSEELESDPEFLRATFRKGWTLYMNYNEVNVHALLDVLLEGKPPTEQYLEFLSPVKEHAAHIDLSLQEFDLLNKLLPDVHLDHMYEYKYLSYLVGKFDMYLRLDGQDTDRLNLMITRCLIQARKNPKLWIAENLRSNREILRNKREEIQSVFGSVELINEKRLLKQQTFIEVKDEKCDKESVEEEEEEDDSPVKVTTDVLCEEFSQYQPYDIYYYGTTDGRLYQFSRPEFKTLSENGQNFHTREPLPAKVIKDIKTIMEISKTNILPEAATLEMLMSELPKPIPMILFLQDDEYDNDIRMNPKIMKEVLSMMYGNYTFLMKYYLLRSSTIYSFLYRCYRYWKILHNIESNFTTTAPLEYVGTVHQKFPIMKDIDCVSFIVATPAMSDIDMKEKVSFINFCANWYGYYHIGKQNSETSFVRGCISLLEKESH